MAMMPMELAESQSSVELGSSHKGSTINTLQGNAVKYGNLVSFSCYWGGSATNAQTILTLPTGYRPSASTRASGVIMKDAATYPSAYFIKSDGTVTQSYTSSATTEGFITGSFLI